MRLRRCGGARRWFLLALLALAGQSGPARGRLCVLVQLPAGGKAGSARRARRAALESWARDNATVFFASGHRGHEEVEGVALPAGLLLWRTWSYVVPKECDWVLKVSAGTYVNIDGLARRLTCLDAKPTIAYLGVPKVVQTENGPPMRIADGEAGIVLRRDLLRTFAPWLTKCLSRQGGFPPVFFVNEDVALGTCLWLHGVELHSWLDPQEEAVYSMASNVMPYPGAPATVQRPFDRVMAKHGSSEGLSTLQCVLLVSGLRVHEVSQVDTMMGKSKRWFRNIACVPGGLMFPELTSAHSVVDGKDRSEPVFSPAVRKSLQECFLTEAFTVLHRAPVATAALGHGRGRGGIGEPAMTTPSELFKEWKSPQPSRSPAADRLRQSGPHLLCIFVLATAATARHVADAAAVLRSWAAPAPPAAAATAAAAGGGASGEGGGGSRSSVEVVLVDRITEGPEDKVLRLRGDVDLGFLYNSIRAFYLWGYLSKHHIDDCEWFAKVDADTFVNTEALKERLHRYFNPAELHYLGSVKETILGSGRKLRFAVNTAILSRELLRQAGPWLEVCMDDQVHRKLGRGAEDIDLAYCLDFHGEIKAQPIGARQEIMSRGMVSAGGSGSLLPPESGACTLLQHPVHSKDMLDMYAELLALLRERRGQALEDGRFFCDWPEEKPQEKGRWDQYMKETHAGGWTNCWMGDFTWRSCCDTRIWGPTGNPLCWDEEHRYDRCCQAQQALPSSPSPDPPQSPALPAPPPAAGGGSGSGSGSGGRSGGGGTAGAGEGAARKHRSRALRSLTPIEPLSLPPGGSQEAVAGNPKCWNDKGWSFEVCCLLPVSECWAWPYTRAFCCEAPLPSRRPIQVGGFVGDLSPSDGGGGPGHEAGEEPSAPLAGSAAAAARQGPRNARCATAVLAGTLEPEVAEELLACTKSLDEIGALFEMSVIGSGDKGSGWHDYLGAYERLLLHLPLTAHVLEAGVRAGASLAMWSEYFPFGRIVGIDKDLSTFVQTGYHLLGGHGAFTQNNVRVVQANASDVSVVATLKNMGVGDGWADVIVDDANHWARDQIARFEILFPVVLSRGGVYIIEDVHIQVPYTHDGTRVRSYFANLSASAYLTDEEILVGAHQIEARRRSSDDWRHQVESVTFMRDLVAIAKAA